MDTTKPVTHVSLCAGYGGIDLGLKRAIPGLRTIAFSEIEAFACANLVAKMEAGCLDAAPIWTDVKTFPWEEFRGKVDILSGGYPCQPFSAAGKRLGKDDPRHLWPWIADGIRVCRPAVCFFENVEGHISLGLREVIGELEEIGYRATWGVFSAAEVGAPHQRKRVFILAYDQSVRIQGHGAGWLEESCPHDQEGLPVRYCEWPSRPGQPQFPWEPPRVVAYGNGGEPSQGRGNYGEVCGLSETQCQPEYSSALLGRKSQNRRNAVVGDTNGMGSLDDKQSTEGRKAATVAESSAGLAYSKCSGGAESTIVGTGLSSESGGGDTEGKERDLLWQTEPALGGDADGASGGMDYAQLCVSGDNRTDELRLLGNGVVPGTAERAFRTLIARFFP
jgi:DNA (cytosine-5)-methyltransferase 1